MRQRLLILDDERSVLFALSDVLRRLGRLFSASVSSERPRLKRAASSSRSVRNPTAPRSWAREDVFECLRRFKEDPDYERETEIESLPSPVRDGHCHPHPIGFAARAPAATGHIQTSADLKYACELSPDHVVV